ncbi:hypothetical protein [Psittacicella hinzii]
MSLFGTLANGQTSTNTENSSTNETVTTKTNQVTSFKSNGNNTLTITSNTQELEQQGNGNIRSVFVGNVVVTLNHTTRLNADRIVVTVENGKRIVVAYGKPVVITNSERQFKLVSNEVHFDVNGNLITSYNSTATLQGNTLTGKVITYNTQSGNISATGSSNQQVRTVINNYRRAN